MLFEKMRQRMVIEHLSPKTIQGYLNGPKKLIDYWNSHPKNINNDMIFDYLIYLKEDLKLSRSSIRVAVSGIKYLYKNILNRSEIVESVPYPRKQTLLPVILSMNELKSIFEEASNIKYRLILKLIYSAGLRRGEAQRLCIADIDYMNMKIHIRQGKGHRDRFVILSNHLINEITSYCREYSPVTYLFNGRDKEKMISDTSLNWILKNLASSAGITKRVSINTLRHSFACHHLMMGTNLFVIQKLLGHANIHSTITYLQVTNHMEASVSNPLDIMYLKP